MKHRLAFAGKKLLRMALLLLGVSFAAFVLMAASPLDPLRTNVGQAALGTMSSEQIARLEDYWGVNTPPLERYGNWLSAALHGDFGTSLLYRQPVTTVIGQRLVASLGLMVFAWLLAGALGFLLGCVAGAFRDKLPDKLIRGWCLLLSSTPSFWLAILLLLVFAVWLGWLPIGLSVPIGADAASVTLMDRLRHAALPALTLQFASVSEILGGSVLVEQVFSYPGLGQAAVAAGVGGDLPLLLGITVLTAALVFGGNLAADLLYGVIDPRIRRGAAKA